MFYGRNHNLVSRYRISVSQMIMDMFYLSSLQSCLFVIHDLSPAL